MKTKKQILAEFDELWKNNDLLKSLPDVNGKDYDQIKQFLSHAIDATEERVRGKIEEVIEESMIRKNRKNSAMYGVEIDNYNMALEDLLVYLNDIHE